LPICLFSHENKAFEEWRTDPAADEWMESASDRARDSASNIQSPTPSTTHCEEIRYGKSDETMIDRSPESDNEVTVASNRAPPREKISPSYLRRKLLNQLDNMVKQPTEQTHGEVADSGVAETSNY
jgi:hypothetical protein